MKLRNCRCNVVSVLLLSSVLLPDTVFCADTEDMSQKNTENAAAREDYKPKPIPAGQDVYTWKDFNREYNNWLARLSISVYEKYGSHSPVWDDKFKRIIKDQYCRDVEVAKKEKDILKKLQDLDKLGCNDPQFYFLYSIYIQVHLEAKEALALKERTLNLMEERQYPPYMRFLAARNLFNLYNQLGNNDNKKSVVDSKRMKYLGEAASQDDFKNGNQRFYFSKYREVWYSVKNSEIPPHYDAFMEGFEAGDNVDPWIKLMVEGYNHTHEGWKARGTGYASTVTDEGWRIFGEELQKATACFSKAYEMNPGFPESSAKMVAIAMASSCGTSDERMWFDRAVAVQFDYEPAYKFLLWALRPRWGGSHRQMYEFGVECLNTKRFETSIPVFFRTALNDIGSELDDWRDVYRAPGVYENCKIYFEGMRSEPSRVTDKKCWTSHLGMVAWLTGHYDEAQKIFDELGDRLEDHVFTDFKLDKDSALAETRLMTGPFKDEFAKAERLYDREQSLEAIPLFEKLQERMQGDRDVNLIKDRLAVLYLKSKYEKGDWVDLNPEKSMTGWSRIFGNWSVDEQDGALVGKTTGEESYIMSLCKTQFDGNYEIRGEIEAKNMAGINLGYYYNKFMTLRIERTRKHVGIARKFYSADYENRKSAENLPVKCKFHLTVNDGCLSAVVDGRQMFSDEPVRREWWNPNCGQIGFGDSFGRNKGHVIKYHNLQIRKLPEKSGENTVALQ